MRNSRSRLSDVLFPRIRQRILGAMVLQPERAWYLSDLAKHLNLTPSSLQRELSTLTEAGILVRRADGNRKYYQADSDCPILPELRGILVKTAGVVDVLRDALEPLGEQIDCAFIYGSYASGTETSASDIDLMIVSKAGLARIAPALRASRQILGRPVNPSVFTRGEFAKRAASGHHFVQSVLNGAKIFVIGTEDDLERIAGAEAGRGRADQ